MPDVWSREEIREFRSLCSTGSGNCQSSVGNSFFNFNSIKPGNGTHCFKFEWCDGSKFSFCQEMNPLEHHDISSLSSEIYYTRKSQNSNFESGDVVRFSGLYLSQIHTAFLDGNRGGQIHYGVAVGKCSQSKKF